MKFEMIIANLKICTLWDILYIVICHLISNAHLWKNWYIIINPKEITVVFTSRPLSYLLSISIFLSGSWYNCQTGKKLSNTNPEHYYLNIPILTLTFDLVSRATSKLKCRHQKVCLLGVISLFYSDCICNFVVFNGCVHQSYWD